MVETQQFGVVDIGSRRELFVDRHMVSSMTGAAELRLHHPMPQEVAVVFNKPWEGNSCGYVTVFRDDDLYRMYYKSGRLDIKDGKLWEPDRTLYCYAESDDGAHWRKPELGLYEFDGSRQNNIVWIGEGPQQKGVHFSPFKDVNPDCQPEARYKAVGAARRATQDHLYGMKSPDGIQWKLVQDEPIVIEGRFDSQNLAFWDQVRCEYRVYCRDYRRDDAKVPYYRGIRDIRTATSQDFIHWTDPMWLEYDPGRCGVSGPSCQSHQLYTNGIIPYYRAPHIFLGFPTRYLEREWSPSLLELPEPEHRRLRSKANTRYGTALTDGLLMSSRDGTHFDVWPEAFLRPGVQREGTWAYGDHYQNWGLVETNSDMPGAPQELSVYANEGQWVSTSTRLRRYILRVDGFASVHSPLGGGEMITKLLRFEGRDLVVNFSTSAGGSIRVELQDEAGEPIPGFTLSDCSEIFGDALERRVQWKGNGNLSSLFGMPVRLRFVLRDADLYSFRFAPGSPAD